MSGKVRVARFAGLIVGILLNRVIWDMIFVNSSSEGFNIGRLISSIFLALFFAGLFQHGYEKFFANKEE